MEFNRKYIFLQRCKMRIKEKHKYKFNILIIFKENSGSGYLKIPELSNIKKENQLWIKTKKKKILIE